MRAVRTAGPAVPNRNQGPVPGLIVGPITSTVLVLVLLLDGPLTPEAHQEGGRHGGQPHIEPKRKKNSQGSGGILFLRAGWPKIKCRPLANLVQFNLTCQFLYIRTGHENILFYQ